MDDAVVAFCRELVRIPSTPGEEREVVARVAAEMRALGYDEVRVDGSGNAVGRLGPPGRPALLIDGHVDTVPARDPARWRFDPLSGAIAEGRLWGLGSVDMKGAVAAAVVGLGALAADGWRPARPVYLVASIAEETLEGAALRGTLAELGAPDRAVVAEPTSLRLATAQRGRARVRLTVTGRSCHAANPERGVNAIEHMADVIGRLRDLPAAPPHPVLGPATLSVLEIESEPRPSLSAVPDRCVARLDGRLLPGRSPADLADRLRALGAAWARTADGPRLDVELDRLAFTTYAGRAYDLADCAGAWETDRDGPLVGAARAALVAAGLPGELGCYHFCTNGSLTAAELGVPTLGFGPGDPRGAHVVDESVALEELALAARAYARLARDLAGSA